MNRLALSGLLRAGKDWVAEKAGFQTLSFAEPMYAICKYIFGECDKDKPDHRKFLQTIGQWGWGHHDSETAPHDVTRAAFVLLMRRFGSAITHMSWIEWEKFGQDQQFWVNALLAGIRNNAMPDEKYAVTNCRFEHELEPLKEAGFEHYLVCCRHDTRIKRNGGPISEATDNDVSEQLARKLRNTLPFDRIVWNDSVPMPQPYLTVDQFLEKVNA